MELKNITLLIGACLKSEVFATSDFRRQHCLDCKRNHSECRIAVYKILAGQAKNNKKKLTFFFPKSSSCIFETFVYALCSRNCLPLTQEME